MTTLDDLARVEREYRERHGKDNVTANSVFALKLADTIAAYVKAQRERDAANGWHPIESAPKDGTVVLFHVPSERLPSMSRADDLLAKPYWLRGATHWMPLPSPPNPKAKGFKEPTP